MGLKLGGPAALLPALDSCLLTASPRGLTPQVDLPEFKAMMRRADTDGDGDLSGAEIKQMTAAAR